MKIGGTVFLNVILIFSLAQNGVTDPVRFDSEDVLELHPKQAFQRFVNFRPIDGEVVDINPPRMSWGCVPGLMPNEDESYDPGMIYTMQISSDPEFKNIAFEVRNTPLNFYNFISPLDGKDPWHWRVEYTDSKGAKTMSDVRSFTIADDATVWDRSKVPAILDEIADRHPRILFTEETWPEISALKDKNKHSAEVYEYITQQAEKALKESWWTDFPEQDNESLGTGFRDIGYGLVYTALAYRFTGDKKYARFKELTLKAAAWEPGGYASPEGMGKSRRKWSSHLTSSLGLILDWAWDEFDAREREQIIHSLDWRIRFMTHSFNWRPPLKIAPKYSL